jgi:hypothetical protein
MWKRRCLIETDFELEAKRIQSAAQSSGITLKLLGALAIRVQSETARRLGSHRRISDLDFFGLTKQREQIITLFGQLGYSPAEQFNFANFPRALKFFDSGGQHVDVWLDKFEMCHRFDFSTRLDGSESTLKIEDLLMTKLQIVELNEKDIIDIACLLTDHELNKERAGIDAGYVATICSADWGIYKTFTTNIKKILRLLNRSEVTIGLNEKQLKALVAKLTKLLEKIETSRKTLGWRMRAKIGERKVWYDRPTLLD